MDIKSKSYKVSKGWTILVFILCVVFFISTLTVGAMGLKSATDLMENGIDVEDLMFSRVYTESVGFQQEFAWKTYDILNLIVDLKGEDYIKTGQALDKDEFRDRVIQLFYDKAAYDESLHVKYGDYFSESNGSGYQLFVADYGQEVERIRNEMIADQLRFFEKRKKELDEIGGFKYYATDGNYVVTNLVDDRLAIMDSSSFLKITGKGEYLIYQDGEMDKSSPSQESANRHIRNNDRYLEDHLYNQYNPDLKVYLAFQESYLEGKEKAFHEIKEEAFKWIPILTVGALLTIAALVFLMIFAGRKNQEGIRPSYRIDRIFTEIHLLIIAGCLFGGGVIFIGALSQGIDYGYSIGINTVRTAILLPLGGAVLIGLIAASVGLIFIMSCVRNIKAGRFLKNSLIYRALAAIFGGISSIYHGGSVMRKVVIITLAVCILSATVVLAPVMGILILVLAPKWVREYEEIKRGVSEVRNGNLTYKIPVSGDGELSRLATEINEISAASNLAIQNELKNQRLKTDLISNVSHDLKTPLTSIITYIDLLKKEGLDSENAPQYLEVLDQKSMRLQKLTEDLFDAAKASSGAIPVRIETVDMLSLINQGLGEMEATIEASGLDFIVNAKEERYYVQADGQLLWRVVENLLGNVLKYALPGSRVYIDLKEAAGVNGRDGQVLLEIKNISKTELNINADELMERFKRGDESRSSEGSGLGLAIAKDLLILQKGWFEIKIDGDLFKAVVMLPRALPQNPEPEHQQEGSEE